MTKSAKEQTPLKLMASYKTSPDDKKNQAIAILALMYKKYLERLEKENTVRNIL